ncbi:hypothetical protein COLO4_05409 [Corchorus olitorius]|uniref:Uncharacterized protein n=1 Tax=Corchorus olitorius TaxID=93759 RepID=A0A1R3KR16_9ROSI|nr:hypothetical protein COLO4_05409 [Corchorus olitorius]
MIGVRQSSPWSQSGVRIQHVSGDGIDHHFTAGVLIVPSLACKSWKLGWPGCLRTYLRSSDCAHISLIGIYPRKTVPTLDMVLRWVP